MTFIECDFDQPAIPAIPEIPALPAIPEIPGIPAILAIFGRCQKWTWSEPARGKSTSSRPIYDSKVDLERGGSRQGDFEPCHREVPEVDLERAGSRQVGAKSGLEASGREASLPRRAP